MVLQSVIHAIFDERRVFMKGLSVLAAAVMVVSPALASSDVDFWVQNHNLYTYLSSAQELTGKPEETDNNHFTFKITENVHVLFNTDGDKVSSFSCVCLSDDEVGEFLAQCVTACYSFGGIESGTECYDPILYRFLLARGGQEQEEDFSIPGLAFSLGKAKGFYYFILSKVR